MDTLFESKRIDFARLVSLGMRLGLTRQNPELNRRLAALEREQARIAEVAGQQADVLRAEWQGADLENQRLRTLKKAYVSGSLDSDFQAEG